MLGYYAIKIISKILCIAPKWFCDSFANIVGSLAIVFAPSWRQKMGVDNICECLGVNETRAKEIYEKSMKRFGRMAVEVLRFPLLNKDNLHELIKVEGLEYLSEAYKMDKGVIMCTGHYGNWELLGATVALLGYPMLSITRKQNNGAMDKLINEFRQMVGQKVTYNHGGHEILAISRMLKEKNLLGVLYDQDTNAGGIKCDIFGKPSRVPMGAAALSRMHGSPILPIFLHNNEDGTCTAKIYPPLFTPKTNDKDQDFYDVTRKLVTILEHEIIECPEMWFWAHDRWKDGRKKYGPIKKKR